MRNLDHGGNLILREGRHQRTVGPAIVGIHLDPVGTGGNLLARNAAYLIDAAGFLRPLRNCGRFGKSPSRRAISAGGDNGPGGDQQARADDRAVVDGALERDIGVIGALGTEVAQSGKAGRQRGRRMFAGRQGTIGHRFAQDLIVPRRLIIGMQK